VVRVVCNNKRKTATVTFTEHRAARRAKEKGRTVHPSLPPVTITYSQQSPRGDRAKPGRRSLSDEPVAPAARPLFGGKVAESAVAPLRRAKTEASVGPVSQVVTNTVTGEGQQSQAQLVAIMQQPTHSDGDRWTVLEARDKYMRLRRPRSVTRSGLDIQDMNLVGTCPDFCPEKERYERAMKNRLEWYEKGEGGGLDHRTVVKEHSRSAADQGVPLPHELRPAPVLAATMDYLMCNVVDRIDHMAGSMADWLQFVEKLHMENLRPSDDQMGQFYVEQREAGESVADWFVFMWSVTRAVRKDVSQQNLADLISLSIVEKSARFHILCAERLCEESHHDFSPTLNDENITKCLQTLKYMYYDLSLEEVICPQETEFRAYDILMNLNRGETLQTVQALGHHIRGHPRVRFALKCFAALGSNNYVNFFNLVRQASFLEACILKRYFYQVRRRALAVIQRAFTPGKGMVQLPVERVVLQLGFESGLDCGRFLRVHGVESEDGIIFLERGTFVVPDTEVPVTRSPLLIDSKRTVCYGEVMNGGPLPGNPYVSYRPHCSFDGDGVLRREAWEAEDQVPTVTEEELERSRAEEEQRAEEREVAREAVEELVEEVLEEEAELTAEEAVAEAEVEVVARELCVEMEEAAVVGLAEQVASETLRAARNRLLQVKMAEVQRLEEEEEACGEALAGMVDELVVEVAGEEMEEVERRRQLHQFLVLAEPAAEGILLETVCELVAEAAAATLRRAEALLAGRLAALQARLRLRTVRRCFTEWRRAAARSTRQRQAVLDFPAAPGALTGPQQNMRLG
jgi:hypothetical protein